MFHDFHHEEQLDAFFSDHVLARRMKLKDVIAETKQMKWADLCCVAGQEQDCLQILKYLVLMNLASITPIFLDRVVLHPKPVPTPIDWVFVLVRHPAQDEGEFLFCELPRSWTIRFQSKSPVVEPRCTDAHVHHIARFLHDIHAGVKSRPQWERLVRLITMIRAEFPARCVACREGNETVPNVNAMFMDILCQQTQRHERVQQIIDDALQTHQASYSMSPDPVAKDTVVTSFRRDVMDALCREFPFITTKAIDFGRWLHCLCHLMQSHETLHAFWLKLWILLNLYFTEPRSASKREVRVFLQREHMILEEVDIDPDDTVWMDQRVHPLKRPMMVVCTGHEKEELLSV